MYKPSYNSNSQPATPGANTAPMSPLPFQLGAAHLASTRALNQQLKAFSAAQEALDDIDAQLAAPQPDPQALGVLQLARVDAVATLHQAHNEVNQALLTALADSSAFLQANAMPLAAGDHDPVIDQWPDCALAMAEGQDLADDMQQDLPQALLSGIAEEPAM